MPVCVEHVNAGAEDPDIRIKHLNDVGKGVEIDNAIPPRRYYRSGAEMVRMAIVYMEEGQLENAFILFHKYITLFVEKLPKHPEYKNSLPSEKQATNQKLKEVFPLAEKLKATILEKYKREHCIWLENKRKEEELLMLEKLKIRELEEQQRREKEDIERFQKEKQWRLQDDKPKLHIGTPVTTSMSPKENNEVNRNRLTADISYPDPDLLDVESNENLDKPMVPEIPSRVLKPLPVSSKDEEEYNLLQPAVDRLSKPNSLLSPNQFPTETQTLRTVSVPKSLMTSFLQLAQSNTDRNVETCGIIAGKFSQNRFTVTHLLIPKQSGTSDSCTTVNEEELFAYQDLHDLITLGWIHTHPSQTAFMSSVDLHTHCSYQLMMPEAIAIVCSPKYQQTGIYSLTQGYGVDYIGNCREPGFHPHPNEPPLFEESTHVQVQENATVVVEDLRN